MLADFADALQNMHGSRFVHGSLRPSNILWLQRQNKWLLLDGGSIARSGMPSMCPHYRVADKSSSATRR
ncbi:MAG: hypothetical protein HC767_08065 [Akkermansiaceae bacterium]|nr:hypothetical protein [Akkermansiaceae bacterium]